MTNDELSIAATHARTQVAVEFGVMDENGEFQHIDLTNPKYGPLTDGDVLLIRDALADKRDSGTMPAMDSNAGGIGPRQPDINFPYRQLQRKYGDHAADFGVTGNANKVNLARFQAAMERHIADPATQVIKGTFKKTIPVTHYVNPNTGLNVMKDASGNFLSGWKLNPTQLWNVLNRGSL
jgi:hypothetical protein